MLPIYICDDDARIRAVQEEYLKKQITIEGYGMEIALSSAHPREILDAVAAAPKRGIDFMGSIQELEEKLGGRFLRVHRAYLVNVEQMEELDLKRREIRMKNGERCLFSRNVKSTLLERICCEEKNVYE
ncbi:MAG: LytTR family transcriptional regulator [Ruminococcus sp.]|jgi:hypothetical protein|nr:LytTR family transcriptional regulator [Ruminococcus sp.]